MINVQQSPKEHILGKELAVMLILKPRKKKTMYTYIFFAFTKTRMQPASGFFYFPVYFKYDMQLTIIYGSKKVANSLKTYKEYHLNKTHL